MAYKTLLLKYNSYIFKFIVNTSVGRFQLKTPNSEQKEDQQQESDNEFLFLFIIQFFEVNFFPVNGDHPQFDHLSIFV